MLLQSVLTVMLVLGATVGQELIISRSSATVNEGGSFTVTVALTEPPPPDLTAAVLNSFSPSTNQRLSLQPEFFDFSDEDYSTPKTLTVTATENDVANTQGSYTLRFYMVIDVEDNPIIDTVTIPVTVIDNDAAGVTFSGGGGRFVLIEGGTDATLTSQFTSQPSEDVTISFAKLTGDVTLAGGGNDDILLSPTDRAVAPSSWNTDSSLSLGAIADFEAAEPRMEVGTLALHTASADVNYDATPGARRFTFTPTSGSLGGSVVLIIGGDRTAALSPSAQASAVSSAIEAVLNVGVSTEVSSGASVTWDVTFTEWVGAVPAISIDTSSLTGGTASVITTAEAKPAVSPSATFQVVVVDQDAPVTIAAAEAANTGNQPGPGVGDSVTVTFSEDTDRAVPGSASIDSTGASLTKAQVDAMFTFSASLGDGYSGTIPWETLTATGSAVGSTVNAVATTEDLSFLLQAGDRLRIAGVVYTVASTFDTRDDLMQVPLTSALQASGGGLALQRLSRSSVVITLTDVTNQDSALDLRVGVMDVNVPASAGLSDFFSASTPALSTVKLSGTWGDQPTPTIASATAADSTPAAAGITAQDTVTVVFSAATNKPPVNTAANVAALIAWSSDVGDVRGEWTSDTTLLLRLQDPAGVDLVGTAIGNLRLTLLAGGNLRSADESSDPSTDSTLLDGTWGQRDAPLISSAVAADPSPVSPGISNGDTITITFDVDTNQPAVASKSAVDTLISFSSPVGTDYSGSWTSAKVLVIALNAVGPSVDPADTRPGVLTVTLKAGGNLRTSDLSSAQSTDDATVTGSWGARAPPTLVQAEASDLSPVEPGISDADRVTLTFDSDTNEPSLANTAAVENLFSFSSQAATDMSGTWTTARTAVITLNTVPGTVSIPNTKIGTLQVTVLSTGNLLTADYSSGPANNTATLVGTWGDWPAPLITSAVAADTGNAPGVSAGDTIRLTFDQDTNAVAVDSGLGVDGLLQFSSSLGSLSGAWESASVLVVTVVAPGVTDPAAVRIGVLGVEILQAAGLKSQDESSASSSDDALLTGTFGAYSAPTIDTITAMDRNSPVIPGISAGDVLEIVFNIASNEPDVSTKAAVDALLAFSSPLGANYVGNWVSSSVLELTLLSAAGADTADTAVGVLTVDVLASGNLRSADESSPQSQASGALTLGSWGDYPPPAVASVTAVDTGNAPGLNGYDTLEIAFDADTNTPALPSKGAVDGLFAFSSPLGDDYFGAWASSSLLVLNVTDASGIDAADTAVGALYFRLKAGGGLRSLDGSSDAATGLGYVDFGTWGAHAEPLLTSATASDTANVEGISSGDTVTATFSAVTSRAGSGEVQLLKSTAAAGTVGGTFTLSFWGETTAPLSVSATSSAVQNALNGLPSIGPQGVSVSRLGPDSSGGYEWTLTFSANCRYCHGDMPLLNIDSSQLTGFTTVTASEIRSSLTLLDADVRNIVDFSTDLGPLQGTWVSAVTLSITLTDVTGVDEYEARTSALTMRMLATAPDLPSVVVEDTDSPTATGTVTVLGSWGERQPPAITAITAADTGNSPGLNNGDSITVAFDKSTNTPAADSQGDLDALFDFDAPLGASYSGTWQTPAALRITLVNVTGADPLEVRVSLFRLRVKQSGGLTSADTSSDASVSQSPVLEGTFGDFPRPRPITAVAANGNSAGLDGGDTITITFDIATNKVAINSDAQVRALFEFSSPIANTLVGTWLDEYRARLTIVTPRSGLSITDTRIGALQVTVLEAGNLLSADYSSNPAAGTLALSGTWGDWPAPAIASAVASDTGNGPGLNAGDSVLLTFDQPTNTPGVPMSTLLSFSTSLGSLSGQWLSTTQLRVTVTSPSGASPTQLRISGLSVTLAANGNLRSQDESSPVSTDDSPLTGSFGDYPPPAISRIEAVDPANPDVPGISNGDVLEVTFDLETNQAPVKSTSTFDKAAVDALFAFSSTLATDYEAKWVSTTVLHITVLNVAAADIVGTAVDELMLTVKASADLRSADESSDASTSSGTLEFGTWGDFDAPYIQTMTAHNGGNAGIDAGDYILIDFSIATNTPAVDTSTALSSLLHWSVELPGITGTWMSNKQLRININAAPTANTEDTRVGALFVELLTSGGLRSLDGSSPAGAGFGYLNAGTWGDRAAPAVQAATAADTGGAPGISIGDTVTLTFGEDTSRPARQEVQAVTTAADPGAVVGGTFTLSYRGKATAPLSASASSSAVQAALRGLPPIGATGVKVSRTGPDSTNGYTWRITFTHTVRYRGVALIANGAQLAGTGAGVAVTTPIPGLFLNSDSVTNALTATAPVPWAQLQWLDRRSLQLTIGDVTPLGAGSTNSVYEELTRPGFFAVSVLQALGVQTADRSSPNAAANVTLDGTWGKQQPPAIVSAEAGDDPPLQPGIGTGDTLTIKFDRATNRPSVETTAQINSLLSFSSPLATLFSAFWVDSGTLTLVLNSVPSTVSPAATRPGVLEVSLKPSGNLLSADRSSDASSALQVVSGSWGDFPAPTIIAALAQDAAGNDASPGLSTLDTLTLAFDIETNTPSANTHEELMQLLTFSSPIGEQLSGRWNDTRTLIITVLQRGSVSFRNTRIGALRVTVREPADLRSIDLSSPPSTSSRYVEGSWGPMPAPVLQSITARNDGEQAGLNAGDTMELRFNIDTNMPTLSDLDALSTLFSPSASLGKAMSSAWVDAQTLRVLINDATGAGSPPAVVPGTLNLTLAANNPVKSADESSPTAQTSIGSVITVTGSWGPYPKPFIVTATAFDSGGNPGLGTGDEINIVFDRDTNQRDVSTHSAVLSLIDFSSSIGSQLRGVWRTPRELMIIIVDASGADKPHLTRVGSATGLLSLSVNADASLRSSDNTSPPCDDSASLSGSWGTRPAPLIASLEAVDAAQQPGLNSGDVLRFTFDTDTSISPVASEALIDTLLAFQYDIGVGYTATWHTVALPATGTLSSDGWSIATSSSLVGYVAAHDTLRLGPLDNLGIATVTATAITLKANVSAAGAAPQQLYAVSRRVLEVTLGDIAAVDIRAMKPGMLVAVREAGDLRTSDLSSVPCTDTAALGGSFGALPPPTLTAAVAEGTTSEGGEGLSPGDRLRLTFDAATNTPSVNDTAAIDVLFAFSADIGSDYRGTWLTADSGITTSADSVAAARGSGATDTAPAPLAVSGDLRPHLRRGEQLRVGSYVFRVALAGLWDASRVPVVYEGRVGIGGLDGSLEAETPAGQRRLADAPVLPACAATQAGDASLPLFLLNPREAVIEVVAPPPAAGGNDCDPQADGTQPGVLTVTVASSGVLRSIDESSDPASGQEVVSGSWNPPPVIRKVVVSDSPASPTNGIGAGDSLVIVMNGRVQPLPIATKADIDAMFEFSAPIGSDYVGAWENDGVAVITIVDPTGSGDLSDVAPGTLCIGIRASAQLRSAGGDSGISTAQAVVQGLWGPDEPPRLKEVLAVNGGAPGLSAGDKLQLVFDKATNAPDLEPVHEVQRVRVSASLVLEVQAIKTSAADSAVIGGTFSLRLAGTTAETEPISYRAVAKRTDETGGATGFGIGESMQRKLESLPGVGEVLVSRAPAGDGFEWRVTFLTYVGNVPTLELARNSLTGNGATVQIRTVQQAEQVSGSFALSLGGATTAAIPFNVSASSAEGSPSMEAMLEALDTVHDVSVTRTVSDAVGGFTWTITFLSYKNGVDVPQLSATAVQLQGPDADIAVSTIVNARSSTELLLSLFSFSSPIADTMAAVWDSPTTLNITLIDPPPLAPSSTRLLSPSKYTRSLALSADDQAALDEAREYSQGYFHVSVIQQDQHSLVDLRSASGAVRVAPGPTPGVLLGGSWGKRPVPAIAAAVAASGGGGVEARQGQVDAGDTITITFDSHTNAPDVSSRCKLERLLRLHPLPACELSAAWQSLKVLRLTVAQKGCSDPAWAQPGQLSVEVLALGGLRSFDLSSDAAHATAGVTGTFGTSSAPDALVSAREGATTQPYLGPGDVIAFQFTEPTNRPPTAAAPSTSTVSFSTGAAVEPDIIWALEWVWEPLVGSVLVGSDGLSFVPMSDALLTAFYPGQELRVNGHVTHVNATYRPFGTPGGAVTDDSSHEVCAAFGANDRSRVVPLASHVGVSDGAYTVYVRSRTLLEARVVKGSASVSASSLRITVHEAWNLRSADETSPLFTLSNTKVESGSFGVPPPDPGTPLHEESLFWVLLILAILLIVLIIVLWVCLRRHYICCYRNKDRGKRVWKAPEQVMDGDEEEQRMAPPGSPTRIAEPTYDAVGSSAPNSRRSSASSVAPEPIRVPAAGWPRDTSATRLGSAPSATTLPHTQPVSPPRPPRPMSRTALSPPPVLDPFRRGRAEYAPMNVSRASAPPPLHSPATPLKPSRLQPFGVPMEPAPASPPPFTPPRSPDPRSHTAMSLPSPPREPNGGPSVGPPGLFRLRPRDSSPTPTAPQSALY